MDRRKLETSCQIENGNLVFYGELNSHRDSLLVQGRNILFAFGNVLTFMYSYGFFGNEPAVREKFQALYDQFELERNFITTPEDKDRRFNLLPCDA